MKYIIDIEEKPLCVFDKDTQTYFPRLRRVKGFNSLVFDEEGLSRLEELTADYINEHFGDLQDTAYKKGFEDGKAQSERGCEECRYAGSPQGSSPCYNCSNYFKNNWTAKDDKIGVGDVVETKSGTIFAVTKITADGLVVGFTGDGSNCIFGADKVLKTGRHFDIASILKDMRK